MDDRSTITTAHAIQDFRSARHKAMLAEILARLKGKPIGLLPFEEVRQKLKAQIGPQKVLKEIPIEAIVGSLNRYQDFSRDFLPGQNVNEERWAKIELANFGQLGLPPIEVYQIGEAYFVIDGNHRVSVARRLGVSQIQAYVTQVHTRVPLTSDVRLEDLILISEYADFLEHTNLDVIRPGSDLSVTVPGQYQVLEEHISVHRYFMGIEQDHPISYPDAVADWYDKVYLSVVDVIREQGLLRDFPGRTEADLYLWIADHRAYLEAEMNAQIEVSRAAGDLAGQYSPRPYRVIARLGNKVVKALIPDIMVTGSAPGEWRQAVTSEHKLDRLFSDILVPVNGYEDGWYALEQAFVLAKQEGSSLHGLYIIPTGTEEDHEQSHEVRVEFIRRCVAAGLTGDLQVVSGDISTIICDRARWNDLVMLNLSHPPKTSWLGRLSSSIRSLIQKCPRPICFTPQVVRGFEHAMLAYDGSLKAQEALFIATYLAGQLKIPLHVITIGHEGFVQDIQADARTYLEEHDIRAEYIISAGAGVADVILEQADQLGIDLLLLGGYSRHPIVEVIRRGDVDTILRRSKIPLLFCR